MPIHLQGLNRAVARAEANAFAEQIEEFPIPTWRQLPVLNSSANRGATLNKARDLFVIGVLLSHALEFGAREIRTEGSPDDESYLFADRQSTFALTREVLLDLGIKITLVTTPESEISLNRKMYRERPDWMAHLNNCFTPRVYSPSYRKNWLQQAPGVFSGFSRYQCGSCVKCRMSTLALIVESQDFRDRLTVGDLEYLLRNTRGWLKRHERAHDLDDFLTPEVYAAVEWIDRMKDAKLANRCEQTLMQTKKETE